MGKLQLVYLVVNLILKLNKEYGKSCIHYSAKKNFFKVALEIESGMPLLNLLFTLKNTLM